MTLPTPSSRSVQRLSIQFYTRPHLPVSLSVPFFLETPLPEPATLLPHLIPLLPGPTDGGRQSWSSLQNPATPPTSWKRHTSTLEVSSIGVSSDSLWEQPRSASSHQLPPPPLPPLPPSNPVASWLYSLCCLFCPWGRLQHPQGRRDPEIFL